MPGAGVEMGSYGCSSNVVKEFNRGSRGGKPGRRTFIRVEERGTGKGVDGCDQSEMVLEAALEMGPCVPGSLAAKSPQQAAWMLLSFVSPHSRAFPHRAFPRVSDVQAPGPWTLGEP